MDKDTPHPPGYYVPIRAPLTIDSDSELYYYSITDHVYSRTSSFNSSSSIDVSSYSDAHTSVFGDDHDGFLAYPNQESVVDRSYVQDSCFTSITRPFVRCPDVKIRPFVRILCEESGSGDFGMTVSTSTSTSTPVAKLTRDSESDGGSVDGCLSDESGWGSGDGSVEEVAMGRKVESVVSVDKSVQIMGHRVRSFSDDEVDDDFDDGHDEVDEVLRVESVVSGDDIVGNENLDSVEIENEGCEVECLNEAVKRLETSDGSSFELKRIDVQAVLSSDSEIEVERVDVKLSELDRMSFVSERIVARVVSNSDSETENLDSDSTDEGGENDDVDDELQIEGVLSDDDITATENLNYDSTKSNENEGCKDECLNEVVKLSDSDTSSFEIRRVDAQAVSSSNSEIKFDNVKPFESDFERIDAQTVSYTESEIENLNSALTKSIVNEGCIAECLNEVVKPSDSDASSLDLQRIDTQIVLSSNSEIETESISVKLSESESEIKIKTVNETEQEVVSKKEEEMLAKMQRVRAKFLRLALSEQLTTQVNGEGGNYKFDFNLTVLVIGKTGVGKSATINSIFGENKAIENAFDPGTNTIQEITGNVDGIQLKVIDTPGLRHSSSDRSYNLRILKSIKRFTRKHTPNVVLYVDRLDTRDVNDSHLLTLITSSLGSTVWRSCIIALTHASCDPANEPSKGFLVQRCRFIQEQIVSCGGNKRPVWLVDNHLSYKHEIIDLDCVKSLACLDQADEYDGYDQVRPFQFLSKPQDVIKRNVEVERKITHFAEYSYRVKLPGNMHWSIGCRLCL